ncbi:MAG: DNA-binding response regulator [Bacteroidetes bacterium]|nr:MAG: DNA-binding response regulator [Bacteroidota bacterium]
MAEELKTIIVDDEIHARKVLRKMLLPFSAQIKIIGEADSVESGIEVIKELSPDLVLLDIQMKDGTGFDLLKEFSEPAFKVIFITAFDQFALRAFQCNAVDYLLKPLNPEILEKAINKIVKTSEKPSYDIQLKELINAVQNKKIEKLALSTSEGLIFLKIKELIRMESDSGYTTFFPKNDRSIVVAKNLGDFEELLPKDTFFRPHQSHIINLDFVKSILRRDGGYALMEDSTNIPISRRRKDLLVELLQQRSIS